jgi:hypothetical protein
MRARVVGLVAIGLGGLSVVTSATAGSWVPLLPVQLELDETFATEAIGSDVTYLDPATLTEVTGDDVTVSVRGRGNEDAGPADDGTAVWEQVSETSDADGSLVATSTTVICLDRWTAQAEDCVAESTDGEPTDIRGLTSRFPADTGRRDYDLWDTTAGRPFPARYAGAERLEGLQVYRFEQEVPEQVIRSVPVPGRLVGSAADEVSADVVHGSTRTVFVDPLSGVVVAEESSSETALQGPDGTAGALLMAGSFDWSDDSVDAAVARAEEIRSERADLRTGVRWAAAGAGAVLLALGALLVARRTPARPGHAQAEDAQPGTARSDDAQDEPVRASVPSA